MLGIKKEKLYEVENLSQVNNNKNTEFDDKLRILRHKVAHLGTIHASAILLDLGPIVRLSFLSLMKFLAISLLCLPFCQLSTRCLFNCQNYTLKCTIW